MKKQFSLFGFAARSSLWKVLALIVAAGAAAVVLLMLAPLPQAATSYSDGLGAADALTKSGAPIASLAAFALLGLLLSRTGCESGGSRVQYTLRRLAVSEKMTLVWWTLCNFICFLALWASQTVVFLLFSRRLCDSYNPQALFILIYENSFMHSLLPMAHIWLWVRNIFMFLCLGYAAAASSYKQRRGKKGILLIFLLIMTVLLFSTALRDAPVRIVLVMLIFGALTPASLAFTLAGGDGYED